MKMSPLPNSLLKSLGRGELLLGGALVLAAALLILPVPAVVVDFLLALNIATAMLLLLLALQVSDALKVAAFPAMLLVTTLFRLALNVSTTRLILRDGDAGEVVQAFGNFVTAGNPLVGGVVFVILTVVQFLVIAKGSERVAEVAARFTLDAMPGKQMSIDADLRSSAIEQSEARHRRLQLERESQFYGAMDGAMKFVKGDAVAGIVITLVNILGGLAVGMLQRGLGATEAMGTYTLLTIGDGLVSQIPALLISTAAGLVVTRVRPENPASGGDLGRQIVGQLRSHPVVPGLAGAVLTLLGLVPGMPTVAFCLLGLGLVALGVVSSVAAGRAESRAEKEEAAGGPAEVVLELGGHVSDRLADRIDQLRTRLMTELGIFLPRIEMNEAEAGRWRLLIDDVPVESGPFSPSDEAGLLARLEVALRRAAPAFVGVQETQDMLDRLEKSQPALVREVVPRLVPTVLLSEILTRLIEEQVPVRNLRNILATLAEWARTEADPAQLAERVRLALAPLISHQVAPEGQFEPLLLDPGVEEVIERSLQRSEGGTHLALNPEEGEKILKGLGKAVAGGREGRPVILTRPEIRRPFFSLIGKTHPGVRVISYLELDPLVSIRPAGKVSLAA